MRGVFIVTEGNSEEYHYVGLLAENTTAALVICPGEKVKPTQACIGPTTSIPWVSVAHAHYTVTGEAVVRPETGGR
jgi:hypothetical protein